MVVHRHSLDDGIRQAPQREQIRADVRVAGAEMLLLDEPDGASLVLRRLQNLGVFLVQTHCENQLPRIVQQAGEKTLVQNFCVLPLQLGDTARTRAGLPGMARQRVEGKQFAIALVKLGEHLQ